jgi:hypothetical protein
MKTSKRTDNFKKQVNIIPQASAREDGKSNST